MRRETNFDVYNVMNDVILLLYLDIVEYYVIERQLEAGIKPF